MSTIQNLFQQAQLAEAAYANFSTPNTSPEQALQNEGFSEAQATAFAAQWRVVSQQPNTTSGFSGTVFQNIATGEYVFAARGSEVIANDWATNFGDIGSDGIAISQGLDLFNYYQRLIGAPGAPVAQYRYIPSLHPADPAEPPQIVRIADAAATGELSSQPMLTSVGHSLGGHLAMMLSRLTTHVGSVTTFNAPGFESIAGVTYPLTSEGFFNLLSAATGLTSMTNGWNASSMTHLDVQGDLVHIIGTTPGASQSLFTESIDQGFIDAHLMPSITDSLALYNLFATLDPSLNDATLANLNTITGILKASSNVADRSLENALDALRTLFNAPGAGTLTATDNRDQIYKNLADLQTAINCFSGPFTLRDLSAYSAAQIASIAQDNIAYRYALLTLSPFVLVGNDAVYGQHNANGELDVYDPATGNGTLSQEWLTDRAAMLSIYLANNIEDGSNPVTSFSLLGDTYYEDIATGFKADPAIVSKTVIFAGELGGNLTGGNGDDHLYGGAGIDTLNGGAGNDHLEGGAGDDILTGGDGNDTLLGGAGNDTYLYYTDDGFDRILDDGRLDSIQYNGVTLTGGILDGGNVYRSSDGFSYLLLPGSTAEGSTLLINGTMEIPNFTNGDFGINLDASTVTLPQPSGTVLTSSNDLINWHHAINGVSYVYKLNGLGGTEQIYGDTYSSTWIIGGGGADTIYGGNADDLIYGDVGQIYVNDFEHEYYLYDVDCHRLVSSRDDSNFPEGKLYLLDATVTSTTAIASFLTLEDGVKYILGIDQTTDLATHYNDYIDGGDGNDIIIGGAGSDVIYGGAGNDQLLGGNDKTSFYSGYGWQPVQLVYQTWLYVDGTGWTLQSVDGSALGLGGWEGSDYLDGGDGNDVIDGTHHSILLGGSGEDVLTCDGDGNVLNGGDGDDTLTSGEGNNIFIGGGGDDLIYGDAYDVIIGGAGNDTFYGEGNNEYLISSNDGVDTIFDGNIQIVFGEGIFSSDVTVSRNGEMVVFSTGIASSVSVANTWFDKLAVEQVTFADGITWQAPDILQRLNASNTAPTGSATAALVAGSEDAAYIVRAAELLQGFTDIDGDTLRVANLTASDGTVVANLDGTYTITPNASFNGAVNLSYEVIDGYGGSLAANLSYRIAAANDVPTGSVTLDGLATQNQTLTAANTLADIDGLGAIAYQWQSSTDGVTWTNIAGATTSSFTLTEAQVGQQVRVNASYTDGHSTVESVNSVATAAIANISDPGYTVSTDDGSGNTVTTNYDANGIKLGDTWTKADGSQGSDTFNVDGSSIGTAYNANGSYRTYVNDGLGDVTTNYFDASSNALGYTVSATDVQGNATAAVYDTNGIVLGIVTGSLAQQVLPTGVSTIQFLAGIATANFTVSQDSQGKFLISSSDGAATLEIPAQSAVSSPVVASFADGTTWRFVNADGQPYTYEAGSGVVYLMNAVGDGTVQFGAGITSDMITLGLGSLVLSIGNAGAGDLLHIEGFNPTDALNSGQIQTFRFADGTTLGYAELLARGFDIDGTNGDDTLLGTNVTDRMDGGAGADTLTGGQGDDTLRGGGGNDRYVFKPGDGSDTIVDTQGSDTLIIGGNLVEANLEGERVGDNLIVKVLGTTDTITLADWFVQTEGVNRIEFADGSFLDRTGIEGLMNRAPVANADELTVYEDGGVMNVLSADLLANDTDPNINDTLSVIGVGASAIGATVTLALSTDQGGQVQYDVGNRFQELGAGQTVTDSFDYTISDNKGATASSVVNVTITGINDAPVTAAPIADQQTDQDAPFSFTIPARTFTDIDNGDKLAYSATLADGSALPSWLVFDAATQTFSGTALNEDVGTFNVVVTATDTGGLSASSTFAFNVINVNDTPTANADMGAAREDGGAVILSAATLLANDTDPDAIHGDTLSITGVSQAASGAAVSLVNGDVQYDIGNLYQSLGEGQTATDTFSYTVSDAMGATSVATVTMTITGTNDGPVVTVDAAEVQEDLNIAATGNVLANDSDVDQGTVLAVMNAGVFAGSYGQLTLNSDGSYIYVLDNASLAVQSLAAGQVVTETFVYQATDGLVATASTLTVTITGTNDAPVTTVDVAAVQEDATLITTGNVLTNDSDVDQGAAISIADAGLCQGNYGQLAINADGTYSYALDNTSLAVQSLAAGQAVTDMFAYQATDGMVATASTLTVTITGTNDAPVTTVDTANVQEDLNITAIGNVLTNDSDVDQGTILSVVDAGIRQGNYGQLTLNADGCYTYAVDNNSIAVQSLGRTAQVSEHFDYTVTDGIDSVSSALDVYLNGTNDAPILLAPLADQDFTFNKAFSWQMPAGTFTDIDEGDALDYTATLADGSPLPDWLKFDAATQTFSGMAPKEIGYFDIRLTATDRVAATGSTADSLATSDVFRLSISHGNEGVGNGQEAVPSGLASNFNDGPGTSPGNPGALNFNDILQGTSGYNNLSDISGNNLFDSGAGADKLTGGAGNDLFIGGAGNDTITTGEGADIIAFNRGDGQDTIVAPLAGSGQAGTADNTLSLGGGIDYQSLAMSKSGNDLILGVGGKDKITLQNWYSDAANHSIANLQFVLDATAYDAGSTDPLLNKQVQSFDFAALAQAFDQASANNPKLTSWSLTDSLLSAHLAGSDTAALGGDLAYQYNLNGTLAGIGLASAQAAMNDASFGVSPQQLHPLAELQTGTARLA